MSKNELIEMIITNKPITTTHFKKDEEMTKEQAIDLINTNQYMKKIAHITLILFIRMSHQECVRNLNDFINNINNEDLKLKSRNMNDYAISVCSEKAITS